ncbi:MAG: sensor histidine kinase [Planctomycetota bacterium]
MTNASTSAASVPSDRVVLAALLHRLGSPLGALVNYVHLADEGNHADPLLRDAWAGIHSAIKDLRTALDGGRRWLNALDVDVASKRPLRDIVDAAEARVTTAAGTQPVVTRALGAAEQMPVPVALEDVLAELFLNAARCGGAKDIHVRVQLEPGTRMLRIAVDDDGAGWPVDDRGRAFEPFRRWPGSSEVPPAGPGCGLSIVALTAARLGGEAWGEHGARGGACVVVTLAAT